MHEYAQAPNAILLEDRVRVFFTTRPKPDSNGMYVSYCAYIDLDRNNLSNVIGIAQEPVMDLGELGSFDEFGTYPVSVIKINDVVHAYYGGWTRCESVPFNVSIGCAQSTDFGCHFHKVGSGPVLGASPYEPFVITSPKIRKYNDLWYLFYTAGKEWFIEDSRPEIVYTIRMAVSEDGVQWTRKDKDIIPNKLGDREAQACPDVIYSNGKYHMFFCYRKAVDFRRNKENSYRIGYASSKDLINWHRDDAMAGIDISKSGFDDEMVAYPHVFEVDGRVYMIYLGNQVGRYGLGLAQLEEGGF